MFCISFKNEKKKLLAIKNVNWKNTPKAYNIVSCKYLRKYFLPLEMLMSFIFLLQNFQKKNQIKIKKILLEYNIGFAHNFASL